MNIRRNASKQNYIKSLPGGRFGGAMRFGGALILLLFSSTLLFAQTSQVKKAAKNMFKLTTFAQDGTILSTGYGVFVDADGTCLSNWTPFAGATSANIIDVQGRKYDVDCLIGASDIYNVAKFRINVPADKKMAVTPIAIATSQLADGAKCWFLEYNTKTPTITEYTPSNVETFNTTLPYYIFEQTASDNLAGSPFLNDNGELLGLMQPSKTRTDIYCPSAQFAMEMKISAMSANDPTLRKTAIRLELPADYESAVLALMMANGRYSQPSYLATANAFISKFPTAYDGYNAKASWLIDQQSDFAAANDVMNECVEKCEAKDDAHFAFSKLIYNKVLYSNDSTYTAWNFEKALSEIDAAYAVNPTPIYTLQKAKILYSMKKYQEAYDGFMSLSTTPMRSAENFYFAFLCKQGLNENVDLTTDAEARGSMEALLDSALACFEQPLKRDAAAYILIRGKWLNDVGEARKALNDYNTYEEIMKGALNAQFYYLREQVALKGKLYQVALNDINTAIDLDPQDPSLYAEKALLLVRVNHNDEAITTADECISKFPDYGDGYAMKGLALLLSKKKKEGLAILQTAKEKGSELADGFIEQYGK